MWLREQVRLMRPKIIVCLGRIAAQKIISPDFKAVSYTHLGKYARGFVYFNARLLAESESCAVIVHTVYAQKHARFVEIDVAGLVKRVFNVYPTVRAEAFEGRVGKLTVNVAAIKF